MKNASLTLLALITTLSTPAYAYKFVIATDEESGKKSEEVSQLLKTTYPFNTFEIEVEIIKIAKSELNCQSTAGIARLVGCDEKTAVQKKGMARGADQVMIVKDSPDYGGSGGGVPIITTNASARVMIHEYLHTLGLCDEYKYKAEEAKYYCSDLKGSSPNIAYINPLDPYASDDEARSKHSNKISWYSDISNKTPITNSGGSRLGTADVNYDRQSDKNPTSIGSALGPPSGLYKGQTCDNATPKRATWYPGGSASIMENAEAGLGGPLEKIVQRLLVKKGLKPKMTITDPVTKIESRRAAETVGAGNSSPEVDNSSRKMKEFFGWAKEEAEVEKKASPR